MTNNLGILRYKRVTDLPTTYTLALLDLHSSNESARQCFSIYTIIALPTPSMRNIAYNFIVYTS
jgi:hypothetical protein